METLERIQSQSACLAVVGLGYVGLPLAIAFADKVRTIGFDINQDKISIYQRGIDPTHEVGDEKIQQTKLEFTSDPVRLREATVIIVAVPTPINGDKTPNLEPVISASRIVGQNLSPGSIVVFESTVYPGVTEEICLPILEKESGLLGGRDFKIGYSPERINPGDKVHRLENIVKIVSGMDRETVENIAALYGLIVHAGVYKAPSIKVAEAAKLAENAQRDINIAFMNELSMIFDRIGIKTKDVLEAMNTKWNALDFYPGLVGGHCIGVDPYYFIYQAETLGYHSQIISAGRKINDAMEFFVIDNVIKKLIQAGKNVTKSNIYVFGVTFKEDCPDMRNSKAVGICKGLASYGIRINVVDPVVNRGEFIQEFAKEPMTLEQVQNADCLIFLVAHHQFKELGIERVEGMLKLKSHQSKHLIVDIKNLFDRKTMEQKGYIYWSL